MMNHEEDIRPPKLTPEEWEEEEPTPQPLKVAKLGPKGLVGDGNMVKTIIVSFIVAVIVVMGLGMMGGGSFVTKSDFETNWANMQASINTAVGDLGQLRNTVNNAVQGIPTSVSSQVSSTISQATGALSAKLDTLSTQVSGVDTELNDIQTQITALENSLATLEAENTALAARIAALETTEQVASSSTDPEALELSLGYSSQFVFPAGATTTGSTSVYFGVENTLDYDVENVGIELVLHSRGAPISLVPVLCKVSGGWPLQWQKVYVGNGVYVLKGIKPAYGDGLEIDAEDDANIFVTVELGVNAVDAPVDDVTFYVDGKVTGYDIKS